MEMAPTLSTMEGKDMLETSLPMFRRTQPSWNLPPLDHSKFGRLITSFASTAEIWRIQDILRGCAENGDAFGIDEFTSSGIYNEKLIRNCNYWVVRNESNKEMLAVILSGESGVCRSHNPNQAAGAIIVLKPYRKQSLGHHLLNFCEAQAQALGYRYILTDVLASNTSGLSLMRKHKFAITGTIPSSCFVKGHGYTDCFLHWKPIQTEIVYSNL